MTLQLLALRIDGGDPAALARFWADLLGWDLADDPDGPLLHPTDQEGFRLRFRPTEVPKAGRNQIHLHLTSSSPEEQQATVERALALGGSHLDVGQRPEEGHIVLADPDGNEF